MTTIIQLPIINSPFRLRHILLKNRIVSTAHGTYMPSNGLQTPQIAAYQAERARHGVGLIILEATSTHPTGLGAGRYAVAHSDECIPGYRMVFDAIHKEGGIAFVQLYHPGRDDIAGGTDDGTIAPTWSASSIRCETNQLMPRSMSRALISDIVDSYGIAAARLVAAGADGIEISAHHGHLISQFLDPKTNLRTDEYGGHFENRFRLLKEIIGRVRQSIGPDVVLGVRMPSDEMSAIGIGGQDALEKAAAVNRIEAVDFIHVTPGTCAAYDGVVHVSAPMAFSAGYAARQFVSMRQVVTKPLIATGRMNDPRVAEALLAAGHADLVGMTRALICDPEMPRKVKEGTLDSIRYCVGCNQACIGHGKKGGFTSCIQRPETGRELEFSRITASVQRLRIVVAGGGPAGMKAAITAARRGHQVTLFEATDRLGGQVKLAERLPGRSEFGGVATNLMVELAQLDVSVRLNSRFCRKLADSFKPDVVVAATGARMAKLNFEGDLEPGVLHAWEVIEDTESVGSQVVIADATLDWVAIGVAELLARAGRSVRLCALGFGAGENIPSTIRAHALGVLHGLGVEVHPLLRLGGFADSTAYFQHASNGTTVEFDHVDTLIVSNGGESDTSLEDELMDFSGRVIPIGDCLGTRSVEEAILEGLRCGSAI